MQKSQSYYGIACSPRNLALGFLMTLFAAVQLSWTLVWIMHPPTTPEGAVTTHSSIAPLMITWMCFFSGAFVALSIVDANGTPLGASFLGDSPPEMRMAILSKGATRSSC